MINYQENYRRYQRYYRRLIKLYRQKPVLRDFTFLILSLLTASFFGFFAIKPSLKTIGRLVKEIKDQKIASQKLEAKINALSLAQREYARVQPSLPKVYAVLPKENNFSQLAKKIEYLAQKNEIVIVNLQTQKLDLFGEKRKSELVPLEIDLVLNGNYSRLKNFMRDLERLDRLLTINSFFFSKNKLKKGEVKLPLSLKLNIQGYYLP